MRNDGHLPVSGGNGASRRILNERPAHSLEHEVRINEEIVQLRTISERVG